MPSLLALVYRKCLIIHHKGSYDYIETQKSNTDICQQNLKSFISWNFRKIYGKLNRHFSLQYYDHLIFWWLTNLSQQHNGLFDCVTETEKMFESFALSSCICNNTFVERVMFTFEIGNSKDSVMQCNKFMRPRKYLKVENSVHR